jgi:hypothetical protein
MRILPVLGFSMAVGTMASAATSVPANDPNIQYMGRVDFSDPAAPVFGWAATTITVRFQGTSLRGIFRDSTGRDYLQVMIDGVMSPTIIQPSRTAATTYTLASGLSDADHTAVIIKRTEFWGVVTFKGFLLDDKKELLSPPARPLRRIEFYGDSNVSAHDSEDIYDRGSSKYNNAWYGYAGITARMLNAEHHNLGWGGAGMTSQSSPLVQNVWDRLRPDIAGSVYDFNQFDADVVVINAGSNDSYRGDNRKAVIAGWIDLIVNRIRPVHPHAHIVLADSWGWSYAEPANYLSDAVASLNDKSEMNVSWVSWPWLWGQTHAVVEEHGGFANILAAHIASELGWAVPAPTALSSFAGTGQISTPGFEIVPIGLDRQNQASGWRQWNSGKGAAGTVVTGAAGAHGGSRCAQLTVGRSSGDAGFWQAAPVTPGTTYTVTGYARRSAGTSTRVFMRVEFKDQAQNIISSSVGAVAITNLWESYTSSAVAPANAWSVTVVLQLQGTNTTVQFDDVVLR